MLDDLTSEQFQELQLFFEVEDDIEEDRRSAREDANLERLFKRLKTAQSDG